MNREKFPLLLAHSFKFLKTYHLDFESQIIWMPLSDLYFYFTGINSFERNVSLSIEWFATNVRGFGATRNLLLTWKNNLNWAEIFRSPSVSVYLYLWLHFVLSVLLMKNWITRTKALSFNFVNNFIFCNFCKVNTTINEQVFPAHCLTHKHVLTLK